MQQFGIGHSGFFFICAAACCLLLVRALVKRGESSDGVQVARMLLALLFGIGAVYFLPSTLAAQKFLVSLVMPLGLLWLGMLASMCGLWLYRRYVACAWLAVLWLLLTLAGNDGVSRRLLASLESDFVDTRATKVTSTSAPFDAVMVMGGGTNLSPSGENQLTAAGDRAMLAARLYQLNHAKVLVTGGEANAELLGQGRHPAREMQQIWKDLGIAHDAIVILPGRNTKEEMQHFKRLAEREDWQRLGVVTSAWHMRRTLNLAKSVGLELTPLAADFRGVVPAWQHHNFVPHPSAILENSMALKEYLAQLVGR